MVDVPAPPDPEKRHVPVPPPPAPGQTELLILNKPKRVLHDYQLGAEGDREARDTVKTGRGGWIFPRPFHFHFHVHVGGVRP